MSLRHLGIANRPTGCVQAEMSEDEGHSQGGSDDDADEDGDLVSKNSHASVCPVEYELALPELVKGVFAAKNSSFRTHVQCCQRDQPADMQTCKTPSTVSCAVC